MSSEIPRHVARAFQAMTTGRPRPAALFLPQDLMRAPCPDSPPFRSTFPRRASPSLPTDAIAQAAELLSALPATDHPGRRRGLWSGAAAAVETLAARLGARSLTTLNGKGLLDERHPLSLGHARSARARCVLPHADVMLAVGCRFTEVMTDWRRMTVPANLIQIDLEPDPDRHEFPGSTSESSPMPEPRSRRCSRHCRRRSPSTAGARSGKRPGCARPRGPSG